MTTDRGQDFGSILQRKTILGPRAAWEPGKQLPNLQSLRTLGLLGGGPFFILILYRVQV